MRINTKAFSVKEKTPFFEIKTDGVPIRIWFVTNDIIRIRAGFDGDFAEESYSLVTTAWEDRLDDVMKDYRTRIEPAKATLSDLENEAVLQGERLKVIIQKSPFKIIVQDKDGTLLHSDCVDLAYQEDSNHRRIHTSEISTDDCFYGFGEKSGEFNKYEKAMSMSPKDAMGYNPKETDSLYKHIPFYIKLNRVSRNAVGYFYHNTYECDFDMGRERSNYWPRHSRYRADGGDIDLFLIAGPSVKAVVQGYTMLTGRPALLPKYALGYLGSSMYYSELPFDSDDAIVNFIDTAEKEGIPIDGFQLSSGYTAQNTVDGERRCVFTWNKDRFKDPAEFFHQMNKRGITVSPNVKPGILTAHPEIDSFTSEDILVKKSDSDEPAVGTWWGGPGVFADYTNPHTREVWKKMLTKNVLSYGTTSVWNDNCEYDSLVDKDSRCDFDGKSGSIGQLKSVMSNLMCHITAEAINEREPSIRPFIVCRSGHSGIQRYAQTWAGDNLTCWDALKYNVSTILGMSLCGVMNYGADIGGFYGSSPEPELLVRWVQNGIFQPRFSIHSVNTDNTVTEPWMYPEYTMYIRDAIRFRYQLFPYYYSLMAKANKDGSMILEPLCSAFQNDPKCYDIGDTFMVGDSLLVANVLEKDATTREIYLPEGADFYDFYTHKRYSGGQTISIPVDISSIPLFLRSGAIVPLALNQMMNLSTEEVNGLLLTIVADKSSEFTFYEDDGLTTAYKDGEYRNTSIKVKAGVKTVISIKGNGKYQSDIDGVFLDIISGDMNAPFYVTFDGQKMPQFLYQPDFGEAKFGWFYDISTRSVRMKYDGALSNHTIEISFEDFDMLGM